MKACGMVLTLFGEHFIQILTHSSSHSRLLKPVDPAITIGGFNFFSSIFSGMSKNQPYRVIEPWC
jgi:hypothetical protein